MTDWIKRHMYGINVAVCPVVVSASLSLPSLQQIFPLLAFDTLQTFPS